MHPDDANTISAAFHDQGWNKPKEQYDRYYSDQQAGKRDVLLAFADSEFAGYLTIMWESYYPPFKHNVIPEIMDLNVLKKFQKQGVATSLMDKAEARVAERSKTIGIGVGLTADYGNAQRLYVKRGYIPDGKGISKNEKFLKWGDDTVVDDDLIICLTKDLKD